MVPQSIASPDTPHTLHHIDCPACRLYLVRTVEPAAMGSMHFSEASALWLNEHKARIAEKTCTDYRYYIATLEHFFGELQLDQVHVGHIAAYTAERSAAAGPSCINHEINTLKQILERAGLWSEIKKFYRPLRLPRTVGQALEPVDEARLFMVAGTRPRWKIAYWCSILSATTTAGPAEISHLHLDDIELGERPGSPFGSLRIRDGLKNGHRERILPLNSSSQWAVTQILKRYYKLCKKLCLVPYPDHYILPGRKRRRPLDPSRPIGSWKKAWGALRQAAGLPGLRMYDLRHHAITKLMEDPDISEQTVEEMAGHALSSRMKKRYSHIRLAPKADAAAKLELPLPKKPPEREEADCRLSARFGDELKK